MAFAAGHGEHHQIAVQRDRDGGLHRLVERPEAVGPDQHHVGGLPPDLLGRRIAQRVALLRQRSVVLMAAPGIAEHAIGPVDQGELLRHLGIVRRHVRVILAGEAVVGGLYLLRRGVAV